MFGGEYYVFHTGRLGDIDPFAGVKIGGVKPFVQVIVDIDRNGPVVWAVAIGIGAGPTDFLAGQTDRPPVDEHAEPGGPPPSHPGVVSVGLLTMRGPGERQYPAQQGASDTAKSIDNHWLWQNATTLFVRRG